MRRVAFIKDNQVINVIVVETIEYVNQMPDFIPVGIDEQGNLVKKAECEIYIETEVGSVGDFYEHGVGFYRQHTADINGIEQVACDNDIEEL
jgi:hypothetical protein